MNHWTHYIRQIMQGMRPGQTLTFGQITQWLIGQRFTPQAAEQITQQIFAALDRNHDAVLSGDDLHAPVINVAQEVQRAVNYVRPIMQGMSPGDSINYAGLVQWLQSEGKPPHIAQAIAQNLMNILDKTHDGVLTHDDLLTHVTNIDQDVQAALNHIRFIVQGLQPGVKINFSQVVQWLQGQGKPYHIAVAIAQAIFAALDTSHDGLLTREDLTRAPTPSAAGPVVRKSVSKLNAAEKKELVDAILKLKSEGEYDKFVLRHFSAPMANIHRCPAFLPWHRQFIRDFEQQLQRVSGNSRLALPYWDWAEDAASWNPRQAPIWQDDMLGGNGDADSIVRSGPFRRGQWTIIDGSGQPNGPLRRQFGLSVATLPSHSDVSGALGRRVYDWAPWNADVSDGFRNHLEGWVSNRFQPELHNRGHVWIGGSMLPMTSPNDPAFFLHHCNVDRIWAQWQDAHPSQGYQPVSGGPSRQNLNDQMETGVYGSVTPASVWNYRNLGYTYA